MIGVYPLFNRSAVNLNGAALRVHITATADSAPHECQAAHSEELNSSGEDEDGGDVPTTVLREPSQSPSRQRMNSLLNSEPQPATEVNSEDTFLANIIVDRAMRLSLKGKDNYCHDTILMTH